MSGFVGVAVAKLHAPELSDVTRPLSIFAFPPARLDAEFLGLTFRRFVETVETTDETKILFRYRHTDIYEIGPSDLILNFQFTPRCSELAVRGDVSFHPNRPKTLTIP